MNNNDILKRIRYTFDYSDSKMIEIFELADHQVSRADISNWLKKEDDGSFKELDDFTFAIFLNGLINSNRGKREGAQPIPESRLNNNIILKKLKIALNLRTDDILKIFVLADMSISVNELSAFLRNPKQSQYRQCKDQYLRNFLTGMQMMYRRD